MVLECKVDTERMSAKQRIRRQTLARGFRVDIDFHVVDSEKIFNRIIETEVVDTPLVQNLLRYLCLFYAE